MRRNVSAMIALAFGLAFLGCGEGTENQTSGAGSGGASGSAGQAGSGGGTVGTGGGASGSAGTGGSAGTAGSAGSAGSGEGSCDVSQGIVNLTTDDGVSLEADFHPAGATVGPGAVLLHMVPPFNDRSNYPQVFIDALTSRGIHVINVDRRGAGASGGVADDAYKGPLGKFDGVAAYHYLVDSGCVDATRVAFVGASNGSTTALDYTVYASTEAGLEVPAALVFLTGGSYTENQNAMNDHRTLLDAIPIQFVYATLENTWSIQFEPGAPAAWDFREYDPGAHGTRMFESAPESVDVVADFVGASLGM
jgi:hypothetical protein